MLLVFIVGIERTEVYGVCVTIGVLIHYFSLAAVCWMCAEAIMMFQKFIIVFGKLSNPTAVHLLIISLICWGML